MPISLRPAVLDDLVAINAIYNHYVEHSTCTYQTVPSTLPERSAWFDAHGPEHPVIVAEDNDQVVGWGSLSRFHPRQAYCHSVEDSVYLHHEHQGRGIGSLLLDALMQACTERGFRQMIAVIGDGTGASVGSRRLHERAGFRLIGVAEKVGFKHGRWLDQMLMQKELGEGDRTPPDL